MCVDVTEGKRLGECVSLNLVFGVCVWQCLSYRSSFYVCMCVYVCVCVCVCVGVRVDERG